MNFLFPPSFLFSSKTACAVVPEPAKLSSIMEFLSVASFIQNSIKFCGFGKVKFEIPIFKISVIGNSKVLQ